MRKNLITLLGVSLLFPLYSFGSLYPEKFSMEACPSLELNADINQTVVSGRGFTIYHTDDQNNNFVKYEVTPESIVGYYSNGTTQYASDKTYDRVTFDKSSKQSGTLYRSPTAFVEMPSFKSNLENEYMSLQEVYNLAKSADGSCEIYGRNYWYQNGCTIGTKIEIVYNSCGKPEVEMNDKKNSPYYQWMASVDLMIAK